MLLGGRALKGEEGKKERRDPNILTIKILPEGKKKECSGPLLARGEPSHDLILSQTTHTVRLHAVTAARGEVLDEAETERSSSILVTLELGDGRLGRGRAVEAYDASASGSAAGLILYLGLLDLANRGEQLNEIFVAGGPWKVSDVDDLDWIRP